MAEGYEGEGEEYDSPGTRGKTTEKMSEEDRMVYLQEFMQLKGVKESRAEALFNAGYRSLMDIAVAPIGDLVEQTGFGKVAAGKLIEQARALSDVGRIKNGNELVAEEGRYTYLTTGSPEIDNLIGGGYTTGWITELYGGYGSGKTQACLTASVMATRPKEEGGLDTDVIYVDSEGTFRISRVKQIAEARGFDFDEVASRLHVVRANTSAHQIVLMDKIRQLGVEKNVKLLIVDSIISHFRAEYIGRGALAERQQLLNSYLSQLQSFAEARGAVVLVSNQVQESPGLMFGDPIRPVGGYVLGHSAQVHIYIRVGAKGRRVFKLMKSPILPNGEMFCAINSAGICDIDFKPVE